MSMTSGRYLSYCAMFAVLVVLLSGCAGGDNGLIQDLLSLQKQLATQYDGSNIVVDLKNGNTLGVTVSGSLSEGLSWSRAKEQAREIAESVCQHLAVTDRIDRVSVALERRQDGFLAGVATSVAFTFEKGELGCAGK